SEAKRGRRCPRFVSSLLCLIALSYCFALSLCIVAFPSLDMSLSHPSKILVVGPAWIGDMIMAQSLFKVIKQRKPDTRIDVLASPWTLPLLARMPEVDNTIEMPLGHGKV